MPQSTIGIDEGLGAGSARRAHILLGVDTSAWQPLIRPVQRLLAGDAVVTVACFTRPVPVAGLAAPEMQPIASYQHLDPSVERAVFAAAEDAATEAAGALGPRARPHVAVGVPGPGLCALAAECSADLIVVGSASRGAILRAVLGSVSDHVVHHASCPVMVVPLHPE